MKVLKTFVFEAGDGLYPVDTIEHGGGLWLVPIWLEDPATGDKMPARIIRMDILPHQILGPPQPVDFAVLDPIPKAVLYGGASSLEDSKYVVVDHPSIRRPKGTAH